MSEVTPLRAVSSSYGTDSTGEAAPPSLPLDPLERLAALLVENDFMRAEQDQQELRSFREAQARAFREEVAAMHKAADAIATQALVTGGLTAVSGLSQCARSLQPILEAGEAPGWGWEFLASGGDLFGRLAEPAGNLLGDAPKAHAEADAREARGEAEQAASRAEEAREHRQRVERHTDAVLGLVETTLENEQRANLAILGNF